MKILILSEVCTPEKYDIIEKQRTRSILPSQQNYFWRLSEALSNIDGVNVNCISVLPVSASSHKKRIWRRESKILTKSLNITYVGFINGRIAKYVTVPIMMQGAIHKWLKENIDDEKYIICDVLQSIYFKKINKLAQKYHATTIGVVTDIPSCITETVHASYGILKRIVQKNLDTKSNHMIREYEKYIYLTKHMSELFDNEKPNIVVEGIASCNLKIIGSHIAENSTRIVLYAGGVYEKYGIKILVEAFRKITKQDIELHIYGTGDAVEYVQRAETEDGRIKYCGVAQSREMPGIEQNATLLVNIRPTNEEYTRYSFPSKTIEYMCSGTPLLSSKLAGIPDEYYNYMYCLEKETVEAVAAKLEILLSQPADELRHFGNRAKLFVSEMKNSERTARKVIDFLKGNYGE